jgi:hypothetical protein
MSNTGQNTTGKTKHNNRTMRSEQNEINVGAAVDGDDDGDDNSEVT